ncbi:hypothetical protein E2C06_02795 [Dankookia rubra]|uniref:Uncharacterized protein n=1 Tax=Dankookia rubra TaxID=1442381 RepID=A0A4R5QLA4_9PROT|nr:hypothetical protein [Dankookia rubra]TDH64282.1 hypothetical protein E2C06_02795 [Dankookia rubra]
MRRGALFLLVLAAGCAEMKQAPPALPTAALAPGSADGVRGSIEAMAPAFADRARGLAGRPAAAAQAAAQLEFITAAIPRDPRYAPIPEGVRRELLLARQELRDALGTDEDATPEVVVPALLAAAAALRAGDQARAARALPAPTFRPGGARSVARLGELGPLPQADNASAMVQREVARLDAEGRWLGVRPVDASGNLITTFGLGGNTGVGY